MVAILRFVVLIPSMNLSFDFTCSENQAIVTFESVDIARDVKELFDKGYGNPFSIHAEYCDVHRMDNSKSDVLSFYLCQSDGVESM